jgi:uncharacterized protein with NRDE domain
VCTLAVYHAVLPDLPLVVAANRDEAYARPSSEPATLREEPRVVGGRDLVAGGSWLTLNEHGVVVGVLNRRTVEPPDPRRESRGTLCMELAVKGSAAAAAELLAATPAHRHNPFNILVADRRSAFVAQNLTDGTHVHRLDPGTHVLTNLDLNDPTCPRIFRSSRRFAAVADAFADRPDRAELVAGLRAILVDHQLPTDDRRPTDQLCIHTESYGTRSSSILWVADDGSARFLHSAGAPCKTPHLDVALPWGDSPSGP